MTTITTAAAHRALTEHRHYAYRGCAPDTDQPTRAAGNPDLSVDAWAAPDVDGGEDQITRREREDAAIDVCVGCPVMMLCHTYANSITPEGQLAEPYGVFGGERALERHKRLVAHRHEVLAAAPDARFHTVQKQAVLRALAAHTDPYTVADAAEVDVRTANWQRASLVRLLSLARTASRTELLAAAAERGLLDGVTLVEDDGSVPAIPPPTRMLTPPSSATVALFTAPATRGSRTAAADDGQGAPAAAQSAPRVRTPRRARFTAIDGQLALDLFDTSRGADVRTLFPAPHRLEAAA